MQVIRDRIAGMPRRHLVIGALVAVLAMVLIVRMFGSGGGGSASAPVVGAPVTALPVHVAAATAPGARVITDAATPAAFTAALNNQQVVVVGFVTPGVADDAAEAQALAGLTSKQQAVPGVSYLTYNVTNGPSYGDLATLLGVTDTPAVVIVGSNGRIANSWTGFIDAAVISAAINTAITNPGA
jgi:hypothetical protein